MYGCLDRQVNNNTNKYFDFTKTKLKNKKN